MLRKNIRNLLSDIEKVEYAQHVADEKGRALKQVKDDTIRDSTIYEDRASGEQRSLPNKFIRALGLAAAFELVDPTLDVVNSPDLN